MFFIRKHDTFLPNIDIFLIFYILRVFLTDVHNSNYSAPPSMSGYRAGLLLSTPLSLLMTIGICRCSSGFVIPMLWVSGFLIR